MSANNLRRIALQDWNRESERLALHESALSCVKNHVALLQATIESIQQQLIVEEAEVSDKEAEVRVISEYAQELWITAMQVIEDRGI